MHKIFKTNQIKSGVSRYSPRACHLFLWIPFDFNSHTHLFMYCLRPLSDTTNVEYLQQREVAARPYSPQSYLKYSPPSPLYNKFGQLCSKQANSFSSLYDPLNPSYGLPLISLPHPFPNPIYSSTQVPNKSFKITTSMLSTCSVVSYLLSKLLHIFFVLVFKAFLALIPPNYVFSPSRGDLWPIRVWTSWVHLHTDYFLINAV